MKVLLSSEKYNLIKYKNTFDTHLDALMGLTIKSYILHRYKKGFNSTRQTEFLYQRLQKKIQEITRKKNNCRNYKKDCQLAAFHQVSSAISVSHCFIPGENKKK